MYVYDEGFPAWSRRGYPIETLAILPKVDIPVVSPAEVKAMIEGGEDIVVLDVRDVEDVKVGHIAGSLNIVLEDLMARFSEIPRGKKIVIVDLFGKQSKITGQYLLKQGYTDIVRMKGGMKAGWIAAGYPSSAD